VLPKALEIYNKRSRIYINIFFS